MRLSRNKNQLLIISLAVGFFIGIIYQNILAGTQVTVNELFLVSNLQRYLQTEIVIKTYFLYVLKDRLIWFLAICLLGCVRWKKVYVVICTTLIGFVCGTLIVAAVLQLGAKGIALCIAGVLPQGIFYVAQYMMLFVYWFRYPERQWNRAKTVFVIVMFLVGVLVEAYVNPLLVRMVVQWIC